MLTRIFLGIFAAFILDRVWQGVYNISFHPLRKFPGPFAAGVSEWYRTYQEVFKGRSWVRVLGECHGSYGDVVRTGPNQLHFSNPAAYHDIYSSSLRWDKESKLYESFGEDRASFGLLKYEDAKQRKDVLQPLFSRRAILGMQGLVRGKVNELILALTSKKESSDILFALRCFTVDTVPSFCFSKSISALSSPSFAAPIVVAMDNSLPTFHLFHHFPFFRKFIFSLPPWLAIKMSPETAGLTKLQVILGEQIQEVTTNPGILESSDHPTIYHRLLAPDVRKKNPLFSDAALMDEALTMLFAGGVTVGDTSMTGLFHILSQPTLYTALQKEILSIWPNIQNPPSLEELEKLPLLTATIKESLRVAPGASAPLLRIVPSAGASINGTFIPGGTCVGMSAHFVHYSPTIFADPEKFDPYRWLPSNPSSSGERSEQSEPSEQREPSEARELEKWLIPFSKGPRACLGINLAWCELYMLFGSLMREVRLVNDGTVAKDLEWRDCFTPFYPGRHFRAFVEKAE